MLVGLGSRPGALRPGALRLTTVSLILLLLGAVPGKMTFLVAIVAAARGKTLLHQGKKLDTREVCKLGRHGLGIRNMLSRKPTLTILHRTVKGLSTSANILVEKTLGSKVQLSG
jgi:hypothetical protein